MNWLIEDWRQAWKKLSVQIAGAFVIFGTLPVETQAAVLQALHVPAERLPAAMGLLFIVGRLIAQPQPPSGQ